MLAFVGTMLTFTVGAATNIATSLIPHDWAWAHHSATMWTAAGVLAGTAAALVALQVYLDQPSSASRVRTPPMSAVAIEGRHTRQALVKWAVRLIPQQDFDPNGMLGLTTHQYVFIGDYDEQRHRTLREILSSMWVGDAFDRVANSNVTWVALIFEIGELNRRKLDLLPATWKATFRILSDPKRAARFTANDEELAQLGPAPRDYYSGDQRWWYRRCTSGERLLGKNSALVEEVMGLSWTCFSGTGITYPGPTSDGTPSRLFYVKNVPLAGITYDVQVLGTPDGHVVLK